jgi:hypothetical protein
MKSKFLKLLAVGVLGSMALSAQAAVINLDPTSPGIIGGDTLTPPTGAANCEPGCVYDAFGLANDGSLELLYKADVGSGDSGDFADSYNTVFSNTANDPSDATISYILGQPAIVCPSCYLAIKDGNATPSYYFYDLSGWDGVSDIVLTGFWPNGGAISHVSIWGLEQPQFDVAEPATLGLLGLSLLGFGLARRRRS